MAPVSASPDASSEEFWRLVEIHMRDTIPLPCALDEASDLSRDSAAREWKDEV